MVAPVPETLWVTDGHQGKADAPVARSTTLQLTIEEAHTTPDVVTGMYLLLIYLFMLNFSTYIYVLCFRIVPREWYLCLGIV